MRKRTHPQGVRLFVGLAFCWFSVMSGGLLPSKALAQGEQPIAYIGHGAFFDHTGNQILLTQAFVEQAQAWYRKDMLTGLDTGRKKEFARFEQRLRDGVKMQGQERLVVQQRTLEWLFANSPKYKDDDRTLGKLRALEYALSWRLPKQPGQDVGDKREEFKLNPKLAKKLRSTPFKSSGGTQLRLATANSGQAYINQCMAAKVPIPPTINQMDPAGLTGWKSQGFIPPEDQFIVGTPAEVRTYKSTTPAGMCYALPRYSDATKTTVTLDGVICLSQETSKACFWDNSMNGKPFAFSEEIRIPIGVSNTTIDPAGRYQAGGAELAIGNPGGVCTDCHAGENPYIIHPKSNLGGGVLWESFDKAPQNLPTTAPNRYIPLVAASWPQNQFSQAGSTVPEACKSCHVKGGAGRFPHLSNQLFEYCGTVLAQAYERTMPLDSPGSQVAAGEAFKKAWCSAPPNMASAEKDFTTTSPQQQQCLEGCNLALTRCKQEGGVTIQPCLEDFKACKAECGIATPSTPNPGGGGSPNPPSPSPPPPPPPPPSSPPPSPGPSALQRCLDNCVKLNGKCKTSPGGSPRLCKDELAECKAECRALHP